VKSENLLIPLLRDPPDLSALFDPVLWDLIKALAQPRGVAQIVAFHARNHVPPAERAWCDRMLVNSWRRHDRNIAALDFLLGVLDDAGIPALALKGPMLARRHYSPPFLRRPSDDLDVGIRETDLERAGNALVRAGFTPASPVWEAKARSHSLELSSPSGPGVDLHFRLSHGPYGIPIDEFFSRAVTETLPGGRRVLVLDAADEILQLVLHYGCGMAPLFHSYEIMHIWTSTSSNVRHEAVRRAIDHHFAGVFAATHVVYRSQWGLPLLTPDLPEATTWLHWRITDKLLADYSLAYDKLTARTSDPTIGFLIWKRCLDLQVSDTPADAVRIAAILARSAIANGVSRVRRWGNGVSRGPLGSTAEGRATARSIAPVK